MTSAWVVTTVDAAFGLSSANPPQQNIEEYMNVRRLTVSVAAAGLTLLAAPTALAVPAPSGSAGTGSSAVDTGSAATGSAGTSQTGSAGGAFANCEDVKAAGRAPIFRGEPGFGPHLDPDGDGFACPTV
ncbi:hypothetical protein FMUAM8_14050 [Nocardia cyriacigeorgica]|nr:hypothetical protein FMUAM8_14050 [Nocardia cyriacigeorgica]